MMDAALVCESVDIQPITFVKIGYSKQIFQQKEKLCLCVFSSLFLCHIDMRNIQCGQAEPPPHLFPQGMGINQLSIVCYSNLAMQCIHHKGLAVLQL